MTILTLRSELAASVLALACAIGCSEDAAPRGATGAPGGQTPSATPSKAPAPEPEAPEPTAAELAKAGRSVYLSNCIACHNVDPGREGALGPPVTGASLELLEARLVRGEYPPGYTPKRPTRAMVPMPFLAKQIPALAAYLEKGES